MKIERKLTVTKSSGFAVLAIDRGHISWVAGAETQEEAEAKLKKTAECEYESPEFENFFIVPLVSFRRSWS